MIPFLITFWIMSLVLAFLTFSILTMPRLPRLFSVSPGSLLPSVPLVPWDRSHNPEEKKHNVNCKTNGLYILLKSSAGITLLNQKQNTSQKSLILECPVFSNTRGKKINLICQGLKQICRNIMQYMIDIRENAFFPSAFCVCLFSFVPMHINEFRIHVFTLIMIIS